MNLSASGPAVSPPLLALWLLSWAPGAGVSGPGSQHLLQDAVCSVC